MCAEQLTRAVPEQSPVTRNLPESRLEALVFALAFNPKHVKKLVIDGMDVALHQIFIYIDKFRCLMVNRSCLLEPKIAETGIERVNGAAFLI